MKSKPHALQSILLAVIVAAVTASTATADVGAAGFPSTIDLSLTSWQSPVLARVALSDDVPPPYLAQTDPSEDQPVDVYGFKRKSPTRAFLQSFLIPGWGQVYAKSSFWKPLMFVGLEAAGWAGFASFHSNGNEKEELYRKFADEHWDSLLYVEGLYYTFYRRDKPHEIVEDGRGNWLDTTTYVVLNDQNEIVPRSLSHHAWFKEDGSRVEKDEFYENIGKYNQFNFGWDDYRDTLQAYAGVELPDHPDDSLLTIVSRNRRKYLEMRDDANSEFNKANTMLVATVANHLLAGFWAALDARAYNRAQDQFGHIEPKLRLVKSPSNPKKLMPYLTVGYKF